MTRVKATTINSTRKNISAHSKINDSSVLSSFSLDVRISTESKEWRRGPKAWNFSSSAYCKIIILPHINYIA